jgi:sugar lactone lactonase YvrE
MITRSRALGLLLFATTALGLCSSRAADTIYVANAKGQIVTLSSSASATTPCATVPANPFSMAVSTNGILYVANPAKNSIYMVGTNKAVTTHATTGLNLPYGLALDPAGNLYAANFGKNSIVRVASNGSVSTYATKGVNKPYALAFDKSGNLYVANAGNNTIQKVFPGGATSTLFASVGINTPSAIVVDGSGTVYVANRGNNSIWRYAPNGSGAAYTTSGLNLPYALAIGSGNTLYVLNGGNSTLAACPGQGQPPITLTSRGLSMPLAMAIAPSSGSGTATASSAVISTQPLSQVIQAGSPVTFSIQAVSDGILGYQWLKNGSNIPGATLASYTIPSVSNSDAAEYSVQLVCSNGFTSAPARLVIGTPRIIYVNASATGNNSGTSWANAFPNLNWALTNSTAGCQIWIAKGTYYPSYSDPSQSFTINNFSALYGGFSGTETSLTQRNIQSNVTTLSGFLPGGRRSGQVVIILPSARTVLDGLQITGGSAPTPAVWPESGGGCYTTIGSYSFFRNCTFTNNYCVSWGAGIFCGGDSSFENCTFSGNTASWNGGGAIAAWTRGVNGVGFNNPQILSISVKSSLFKNNTGARGGAIFTSASRLYTDNSIFINNQTGGGLAGQNEGSGAIALQENSPKYIIVNSDFLNNSAIYGSTNAAFQCIQNTPTFVSFANNIVSGCGVNPVGSINVSYTLCDRNLTGSNNFLGSPIFINSNNTLGPDGTFGTSDDGLYLASNSLGRYAGDTNVAPIDDATGALRNTSAGIDLGAYDRNAVSTNSLTTGLVAYYPFQGNFLDYSGRGNNAVNHGTTFTTNRFGIPSYAIAVSTSQYVISQTNIGISGNADRTISLWMYASSEPTGFNGSLIDWGKNDISGHEQTLSYNSSDLSNPRNLFSGSFYADVGVRTTPFYLSGNWHQLVYTFTQNLSNSKFYLDGILQTNSFLVTVPNPVKTVDTQLLINNSVGTFNRGINGSISDVRIYNRALTTNEVSALYQYESTSGN